MKPFKRTHSKTRQPINMTSDSKHWKSYEMNLPWFKCVHSFHKNVIHNTLTSTVSVLSIMKVNLCRSDIFYSYEKDTFESRKPVFQWSGETPKLMAVENCHWKRAYIKKQKWVVIHMKHATETVINMWGHASWKDGKTAAISFHPVPYWSFGEKKQTLLLGVTSRHGEGAQRPVGIES